MIRYKDISIFDSDYSVLVCPVDCAGKMDTGLAAEFKERYYDTFVIYKTLCKHGSLEAGGRPQLVISDSDDKMVLLLPLKYRPDDKITTDSIEACFARLAIDIKMGVYDRYSISFPKFGCGPSELDWEYEVKPILEKYLGGEAIKPNFRIEVCEKS